MKDAGEVAKEMLQEIRELDRMGVHVAAHVTVLAKMVRDARAAAVDEALTRLDEEFGRQYLAEVEVHQHKAEVFPVLERVIADLRKELTP